MFQNVLEPTVRLFAQIFVMGVRECVYHPSQCVFAYSLRCCMRIFFAGLVVANDLANNSVPLSIDIHVHPFANHFIVADLETVCLIQIGPAIILAFNYTRMLTLGQLNLSMFCVCVLSVFCVLCVCVCVCCCFVCLLYVSRNCFYILLFLFVFVLGFCRLLRN